jgi:DNA end-binding protein Ku
VPPRKPVKSTEEPAPPASEASVVRGFWSGNISFGLVSIPVSLISARRSSRASLRMLAPDGAQLRRRYFSQDGAALEHSDIVRGYEYEKDRFVVVTDDELEAIAPKLSQEIDLSRFVPLADIDPMRFENAYFLIPSKRAIKAYRLLASIMEDRGRAGIATFVMRGKQYLVAIIARGGLLRAETLRFDDELRKMDELDIDRSVAVDAPAVDAFERRIEDLRAASLDSSDLEDTHTRGLLELIDKKRNAGKDVVAAAVAPTEEAVDAKIVDLMEYLKNSITGKSATGETQSRKRPQSAQPKQTSPRQPKKPRSPRPKN